MGEFAKLPRIKDTSKPRSSQQAAQAVPAGWYPDQSDRSVYRWWDGKVWTPNTRPAFEFQAPPKNPTSKPADFSRRMYSGKADAEAGTNAPAVMALIGGILSVFINPWAIVGLAGIAWAIVALDRAARYRRKGLPPAGIALAYTGLGLGIVGTLIFFFVRLPLGFVM